MKANWVLMRFALVLLVATAAQTSNTAAAAQEWAAVAQDSTLRAIVAEVLGRNPSFQQRAAALRAARLRIRPAGALPDPMLSAGVMDLLLPGFRFNNSDFTEVDFGLEQEFPWPGTLGARTRTARATAAAAGADEAVTRREIVAATATAYYGVQSAATALGILAQQRRLLDAAVQLSTTRYATGMAPQSDPLQAKLARQRLASEEASLRGEYRAALAALNALRDRPPTDSISLSVLDPTLVRQAADTQPPLDSLMAHAITSHPRLAGRRDQVEQATAEIQLERLGARPDVTLWARYGYRPAIAGLNFPDFFSAGIGIRLPIWAWRKQNRLADAARADSAAAAAAYHDEEARLGRDVTEAAARLDAARERLALLVDGIVPAARGTVESVLRSYQVGRTEFLTLLAVEDALFRAELEAVSVAADYQALLIMLQELTAEESGQ